MAVAVVAAAVAPLAAVTLLVAVVVTAVSGTADAGTMQVADGGTVSYTVDGSTFVDNDPSANAWGGHANGRIPGSELCPVPTAPGHQARCDAAEAFGDLTAAFKQEFGHDIAVTDAYRSYSEQVWTKASKGFLAATPGYSNHGWGIAFDLGNGINDYGSAAYAWMKTNGYRFGFFHPTWAEPDSPDFSKAEPWHWQFVPSALQAQRQATPTSDGTPDGNRALGRSMAATQGWTGSQWGCLEKLWTAESGWNHRAANPTSSAYGIPQSLPGKKMAATGADWRTNPATQIDWGLDYIADRYDTPCQAWAFWNSHRPHWY
ncbi:D-alanyl-D-alanine carboxypeptidase family protein [Isoptericola sp. BMS4]|uniref:aggregation-promoting factor C-terminal-like domain-containing protein n=1 Tax=Isoptericola sp. BMS4 TaxID=2527875 RepID=UPI001F0F29AF|nr:D-alanyl-D-alanine carboxypeptidase family protein [Isoptericola sp. BMS4]